METAPEVGSQVMAHGVETEDALAPVVSLRRDDAYGQCGSAARPLEARTRQGD